MRVPPLGDNRPGRLGQPEVEELGRRRGRALSAAHEEDVAGLQIAVHDAGAVSLVER